MIVSNPEIIYSKTHAQVPTVLELPDKWRIFFSDRDPSNRSFIRYIDVVPGQPEKILYESQEPLLPLGRPGEFDASGTMPSWCLHKDGEIWLYYNGWTQRKDVPYHNAIGVAVSVDGGSTFQKAGGPVIHACFREPLFTGTACVLPVHRSNSWYRCYYLSATEWVDVDGHLEPRYHLKYANSSNGFMWHQNGHIAIDYKDDEEGGICRASVLQEDGIFKMWYCYRKLRNYRTDPNAGYKIGYAESPDGIAWTRLDDQIHCNRTSWHSTMMCYPMVVKHNDRKFMFVNGDGFGKTGFGYTELGW